MYVHAYYCGHMFKQMSSPVSANIILLFADMINADFCRCIGMFTPCHPSVCTKCGLACSKQQIFLFTLSYLYKIDIQKSNTRQQHKAWEGVIEYWCITINVWIITECNLLPFFNIIDKGLQICKGTEEIKQLKVTECSSSAFQPFPAKRKAGKTSPMIFFFKK